MPIIGQRVSIGNTPTPIIIPTYGASGDPITGSLLNLGPETVDLGGFTVAVGAGYPLVMNATFDVDLIAGDVLYGICPGGATTIAVLKLRQ